MSKRSQASSVEGVSLDGALDRPLDPTGDGEESAEGSPGGGHPRRAYGAPKLLRYGSLGTIVRGASAIFPDVGGGKDPTPG